VWSLIWGKGFKGQKEKKNNELRPIKAASGRGGGNLGRKCALPRRGGGKIDEGDHDQQISNIPETIERKTNAEGGRGIMRESVRNNQRNY